MLSKIKDMPFNLSRRSITVITICSIVMTLLCLFYVTENDYSLINMKGTDAIANTAKDFLVTNKDEWETCLDPGNKPEYYLSIVIVTRMDDYAGNQHHRFQNFIDSAYLLAEHSEQKIELLIVEWNPPTEKRRIIDSFRFRRSNYLNHRIITISEKIHNILPNRGNAPLHEFEGKNVGIRFARGEYIVCTNQDDIWSHNFINAIKSRVFKKDTIYLQYQDRHNIHDNLPPSIVNLAPFPTDDILYSACRLRDQDWGNYQLPGPTAIKPEDYLHYCDQAGDFTMAHRDTWKAVRGYREAGGVAWMDIEFIITAVGTFDMKLVYSGESFACHQEHKNEWESHPERITSNQGISASEILGKKAKYVNEEGKWALYHIDIWEEGLECVEFRGGLAY